MRDPIQTERCFWFEWLKEFPWLCYSPREDAAYCLSCVLFDYKFVGKTSRVKNLYSEPFRHWPSAVSIFKIHVSGKKQEKSNKPLQSLYSQTWPILHAVLSNMKGLVEEIDLMIYRNCKKQVEKNCTNNWHCHIIGKIRASI